MTVEALVLRWLNVRLSYPRSYTSTATLIRLSPGIESSQFGMVFLLSRVPIAKDVSAP